jgi:hypothetical protein
MQRHHLLGFYRDEFAAQSVTETGVYNILKFFVVKISDHIQAFALRMTGLAAFALGAEFRRFEESFSQAQRGRLVCMTLNTKQEEQTEEKDQFIHDDLP